ncbi:MAG: hypothetical protein ACR2QC_10925 [Gammaproteobacteria bacterium]
MREAQTIRLRRKRFRLSPEWRFFYIFGYRQIRYCPQKQKEPAIPAKVYPRERGDRNLRAEGAKFPPKIYLHSDEKKLHFSEFLC